jgi:hypothetical protein
VQADYAKPLAETQTRRVSETTALTKQWFQSPVLSGSAADHGPFEGGRAGWEIVGRDHLDRGSVQNEAHEDVRCDREACKA